MIFSCRVPVFEPFNVLTFLVNSDLRVVQMPVVPWRGYARKFRIDSFVVTVWISMLLDLAGLSCFVEMEWHTYQHCLLRTGNFYELTVKEKTVTRFHNIEPKMDDCLLKGLLISLFFLNC
jgi:hypothetical protein